MIKKNSYSLLNYFLFAVIIFAAGCGGGGDGDDAVDDSPPPLPSKVTYSAGAAGNLAGVTLSFEDGSSAIVGFQLLGTYEKESKGYTLFHSDFHQIEVTPADLAITLLRDPFIIRIDETLVWSYGHNPTAGSFIAGDIHIAVNNNVGDSNQPGVDLWYFDLKSSSLTWEQFKTVLNNTDAYEPYQIQAAYAYFVLQAVYDQVHIGVTGIEFITVRDADLKAAGSGVAVTDKCDEYPFTGTQGDYAFTWTDGPGEHPGQLGSGDNFSIDFNDCWYDDSTNTSDILIEKGGVLFNGYWEDINGAFYGFPETVMTNIVTTHTEEDASGIPKPVSTVTANSFGADDINGFGLFLTPDTSGTINLTNISSMAETVIEAMTLPREVGDFTIEILLNVVDGGDPNDLCNAGGSALYTLTPNTFPVAAGHVMTMTFNNCIETSGTETLTYNGTYTLTIDSLTGTLSAATDYTVTSTVDPINVQSTDDVGTSSITGGMRFIRAASSGNFTETSESLSTTPLSIEDAGVTASLLSFSTSSTKTAVDAYTLGASGELLTISRSDYADNFTLSINQPIQGVGTTAPVSGNLDLTAADNSELSINIVNGVVNMEIDTDGDGNPDSTLVRNWDDLN